MNKLPHDVVVTGLGVVSAGGVGLDAHWQLVQSNVAKPDREAYSMKGFKAAPHLSDRRMLKAVSQADALGLAAIESLKKELKWEPRPYTPERTGLYVGAPPASAFDNEFYVDAMEATRSTDGALHLSDFGKSCMSSMPMTLLVGLPNNVLCYGAMIFDARGPNSNYTSLVNGGQMALINGARRVRRGQLDMAVAGGFSMHSDPVNNRMLVDLGVASKAGAATVAYEERGKASGWIIADGAAFVAVERRAEAEARGVDVLATYRGGALSNDARGPLVCDADGTALEGAVRGALVEAGLTPSDIGLVLASAAGFVPSDRGEFSVLSRVFANERDYPALGSSSRLMGHLLEAGGLIEIGLAQRIHQDGSVPVGMKPGGYAADSHFGTRVPSGKAHTLILRASPWGEYSAIVVGP